MNFTMEMGFGVVGILFILLLLGLIFRYKRVIKQKDEKIEYLREVGVKNDYSKTNKIQELEKKIVELNHTIEILESKIKEGTKNQVVSKIDALEARRAKLLERAGVKL